MMPMAGRRLLLLSRHTLRGAAYFLRRSSGATIRVATPPYATRPVCCHMLRRHTMPMLLCRLRRRHDDAPRLFRLFHTRFRHAIFFHDTPLLLPR